MRGVPGLRVAAQPQGGRDGRYYTFGSRVAECCGYNDHADGLGTVHATPETACASQKRSYNELGGGWEGSSLYRKVFLPNESN